MDDQAGNDTRSKQGIDIVTRLREHGRLVAGRDAWDAADEIERLRQEIDVKGGRLDDALDEIERLRAAGDALAYAFRHTGGLDVAYDAPLRAWEEARRG